jgi:hypothetical protein
MRTYKQVIENKVEAVQWNGHNLDEVVADGVPMPVTIDEGFIMTISTSRWTRMSVRPGDYIVKNGSQFSVVAQDVFDAHYA